MKKSIWLLAMMMIPAGVFAQGVDVFPRSIIDKPTASTLPSGAFDIDLRFFGKGGALLGLNAAISDRFMFGASFGGFDVLGDNDVRWNPAPAVLVKYQLLGETIALPAITVGFQSQGFGTYLETDSTGRYQFKSPGFFIIGSKSYSVLERLDFHGGINYSLEDDDLDKDPNLFLGAVLAFSPYLEYLLEYDFAFNDDRQEGEEVDRTAGDGKGYLNTGVRVNIKNVVYLEFLFKNLLENQTEAPEITREFKITYFQFINLL